MIHLEAHTHFENKVSIGSDSHAGSLATYNNKRQKRVTLVRIPRIAVRLNKLNFVGEWRLITFPARSSFPTSTLEIVKNLKITTYMFFPFYQQEALSSFKILLTIQNG